MVFACLGVSCSEVNIRTRAAEAGTPDTAADLQSDEFALNSIPLKLPLTNPKIVISKTRRRLMLYSNNKLVRAYRVGLGTSPVDDKIKEGDRRTPEGEFYIFTKNHKSAFYLSLGLSYPNAEDAERGLRNGLINRRQYTQIIDAIRRRVAPPQKTALGGEIYIHGNGSQSDWTLGCVALDDNEMRELFDAVPVKTTVVIEH
jgi:murein L,D-transpeptidase YafK